MWINEWAGVDREFEKMLIQIFGDKFITDFRMKYPVASVDLMTAFESRKRATGPKNTNPLNISFPFSLIDYYKKHAVSFSIKCFFRYFVLYSFELRTFFSFQGKLFFKFQFLTHFLSCPVEDLPQFYEISNQTNNLVQFQTILSPIQYLTWNNFSITNQSCTI